MTDRKSIKKNTPHSRFSLTIISSDDVKIVNEFKEICKKQRKRYTSVALKLFREYVDDYKATR